MRVLDPRRFWDNVAVGDGCWEWQQALNAEGYGRFVVPGGGRPQAHRLAWELWHDVKLRPWPEDVVCHSCDNPACVRPDHLFVGTQSDNIRDAKTKGRLYPAPRSQPKELCRRGHPLSIHAVMRSQGRICGLCERRRRRKET